MPQHAPIIPPVFDGCDTAASPSVYRFFQLTDFKGKNNGDNIFDIPKQKAHTQVMGNTGTLREAIIYFADFEHCKDFMTQLRWSDGVIKCPTCGADKVT